MSLERRQAVVEYNSDLIQISQIIDAIQDMNFEAVVKLNALAPAALPKSPTDLISLADNFVMERNGILVPTEHEQINSVTENIKNSSKVVIGVLGMHCKSCVRKIEESMKEMDGIYSINVSLDDKCAEIYFDDSKLTLDNLASRIRDLSFTTTLPNGKTYTSKPEADSSSKPTAELSQFEVIDDAVNNIAILPLPSCSQSSKLARSPAYQGNIKHNLQKRGLSVEKKTKKSDYTIIPIDKDVERCFIRITGMTCASCVNNIERNLGN